MISPIIRFTPTAIATEVSEHSRRVIKAILLQSGCESCVITSTARTPARQALAMYRNILARGEADQKTLYGKYGDKVIEEYGRLKKIGASQKSILSAMEQLIIEIGPKNVSAHCLDSSEFKSLNVIDIAPSSISAKASFLEALGNSKKNGDIEKFFHPGSHDPAFHLEIRQK